MNYWGNQSLVEDPSIRLSTAWMRPDEEGRVIDHLGFRVDDLAKQLAGFREAGGKITREPQAIPGTSLRHAFVEGPDRIRIELIEGLPQPTP